MIRKYYSIWEKVFQSFQNHWESNSSLHSQMLQVTFLFLCFSNKNVFMTQQTPLLCWWYVQNTFVLSAAIIIFDCWCLLDIFSPNQKMYLWELFLLGYVKVRDACTSANPNLTLNFQRKLSMFYLYVTVSLFKMHTFDQ